MADNNKTTTDCLTCEFQTFGGAKFCPNCGTRLAPMSKEEEFEVATATIIEAEEDTMPPTPSVVNVDDTPATSGVTQPTVPHTAEQAWEPTFSVPGAMYFKNPTPEMLKQANTMQGSSSGVLFLQSPSSRSYHGKFTLAQNTKVAHVLSGDKIDLSRADFMYPVSTIHAGTVLGGVKIVVPRGVRVETKGFGVLGGVQGIPSQTVHAGQDAPLVVVKGLTVLGGVEVVVNEDAPAVKIVASE